MSASKNQEPQTARAPVRPPARVQAVCTCGHPLVAVSVEAINAAQHDHDQWAWLSRRSTGYGPSCAE
jgi:hypothetical protein